MSAADPNDIGGASGGASESPQPLIGFMSNEEWERLLVQVSAQIGEMEKLPFPEVRDKVFELLAGIDSIHREALRRLVRLFKEGVMEQVVTDPAIHPYHRSPTQISINNPAPKMQSTTHHGPLPQHSPSRPPPLRFPNHHSHCCNQIWLSPPPNQWLVHYEGIYHAKPTFIHALLH